MENRIITNRKLFILLIFGIVLCGICMGRAGMTASAKEKTFIIDAKMLPGDQSVYEVQLQVENKGTDWEGTVRLRLDENYFSGLNDCAYDTELSLPQGSTKQFVVKVPKDSIERTDGAVQVSLISRNEQEVAKQEFKRLLQTEEDAFIMGILSDKYTSLTYLDMGGSEFYYYSKSYPIKLEELTSDNLTDSLDGLDFLVIDSYNTGILQDKTLENIWQWIDNGGMLIIGTGKRAEEVLAGLDDLEVRCAEVYEPGEGIYDSREYVDISQLYMAELIDLNGQYDKAYDFSLIMCSRGDGAVGILPYSLAEVSKLDAADSYEQQNSFVENMLGRVSGYANANYRQSQYNSYYDKGYYFEEICNYLGKGNNRLKFGWLKFIVILYVVFVGPVLYLILRFVKKRDYYWLAVPAATLVGILLVYWAGRGFEVVSTNVYSVTVENLLDKGNDRTYMRCYDAGHKEWALRLAEEYEYAGPLEDSYYKSSYEDYYYRIRKEGDRIFFGMNPSMGFEDGYFQAGIVKEPEEGSIYGDLQYTTTQGIKGTVTNDTGKNFKYFAVCIGEELFVYKNLPAGAEVKLKDAEIGGYYDGISGYCYSFLWDVQEGELAKDVDSLAALGLGIASAYFEGDPYKTVIVGVTEEWDKAVDDNCSEVSYGCLYAVQ